ncbi:MAG: hypothetical protein J0H89_06940 [Rhizobiales bacterium]|jgi:hypothetical protein|nr:hypothetical protein [Hyphomicrobiales bacterium]
MRPFLTWVVSGAAGLAAFAAFGAVAPQALVPAAHAFTIEGGDSGGQYEVPKFDLDEQMRQFRKDGSASSSGKPQIETPFGKGTLEFGVRQGPVSNFGLSGSSWASPSNPLVTRQDFERMVTPENLR